jgi:hypothetical protein
MVFRLAYNGIALPEEKHGGVAKGRASSTKRRLRMAYGIVHHFVGGTKEQYDTTLAAVHVTKDSLPEGQIFHAAGQSAGGWTVVAIHDSKESWERFRDGILMPRLQQGIRGGFTTPPQETTFDVHNLKR